MTPPIPSNSLLRGIPGDAFRPGVFVDGVEFVLENPGLILDKVVEHLVLSGAAIGVALVLAVPLGVVLGHLHRGSFLAINLGNAGRALPSLAVIAIGLGVLGIGFTNVLVALVVLAAPIMLTNAYVGVDEVDRDAVEAARGMGMSPRQVLWRVELPLASPLIFSGVRTASVYVVATATIAAIAGGGGLGEIIVDQASYRLAGVIGAAMCVSLLAFAVDLALGALQRAVSPAPLRGAVPALEPDPSTGRTPVTPRPAG
jgi:osmoprotectant transport system permease protein